MGVLKLGPQLGGGGGGGLTDCVAVWAHSKGESEGGKFAYSPA